MFVFVTICAFATLGYTAEIKANEEVTVTGSEAKCFDFFNKHKKGHNTDKQHKFVNFVCQHIETSVFLAIIALIIIISIVSCVCRCLCGCRRGSGYDEFA